jgi:hypothetical protein
MDGEGMKLWLEHVWSKRSGGLLKKPTSTKSLATKLKMNLAVIPGGLTSQL